MSQACSSPMWVAPWRQLMLIFGRSTPPKNLPGSYGCCLPTSVLHRFSFGGRSEEHTSELQSHVNLVWRLLLEKKKLLGVCGWVVVCCVCEVVVVCEV